MCSRSRRLEQPIVERPGQARQGVHDNLWQPSRSRGEQQPFRQATTVGRRRIGTRRSHRRITQFNNAKRLCCRPRSVGEIASTCASAITFARCEGERSDGQRRMRLAMPSSSRRARTAGSWRSDEIRTDMSAIPPTPRTGSFSRPGPPAQHDPRNRTENVVGGRPLRLVNSHSE